jgi:hypothetical protein
MAKKTTGSDVLGGMMSQIKELTGKKREIQRAASKQLKAVDKQLHALWGSFESVGNRLRKAFGMNGSDKAEGKPAGKAKAKRQRLPGVDLAWVESNLKGSMTLRQLQEKATKDERSALSVAAVLKKNKGKFKAEAGEKKAGVKGKAPQVWSVK